MFMIARVTPHGVSVALFWLAFFGVGLGYLGRRHWRIVSSALGIAAGAAIVVYWWTHLGAVHPYVPFQVHDHVTHLLATGDGQDIYRIATGHINEGYRIARPLPIAIAWLTGLGNPDWMPYGMLVVSIIGCGVLAYAIADWIEELRPSWGWISFLVVGAPGVLATLQWIGLDQLGLGLAIWGWRHNKTWALIGGGLFRETFLAFALVRKKASPILIYLGWLAIVWVVFGFKTHTENFGLFSVGNVRGPAVAAPLFLATCVFALLCLREKLLGWLYIALMVVLASPIWERWQEFTRVLLPVWAIGFVVAMTLLVPSGRRVEGERPSVKPAPSIRE